MALAAVRPVFVSVTRSTAAFSRAACTTAALGTWTGRTVNRAACSSGALGRTGCVRALATKPPDNGDAEEQSRPTPTPEPEYGLGPPEGLLRNVGQVIFMDKPAAGSLALLGLTIGDPYLAGLGLAGGATATITARAVGLDEEATDNGLMGYNGVLVGCAFSQFLAVSPPVALAATVAGAAATAPLAAVLKPLCGNVPQWTLAFNAATLSALLYTRPFADAAPGPPATIDSTYDLFNAVLDTPFVGVSQIFVVDNVVSGNVIALGLLVQQPSWAFHAVGGSAVGALTGLMMGAPLDEVLHGLWGFNSALTALSVAVFYEPSPQTYVLAGAGAAVTAVVFGGLKTALGAFAVPALTLPFCAVATGCYLLGDHGVPGLKLR